MFITLQFTLELLCPSPKMGSYCHSLHNLWQAWTKVLLFGIARHFLENNTGHRLQGTGVPPLPLSSVEQEHAWSDVS